jgi:hypothetical protein
MSLFTRQVHYCVCQTGAENWRPLEDMLPVPRGGTL